MCRTREETDSNQTDSGANEAFSQHLRKFPTEDSRISTGSNSGTEGEMVGQLHCFTDAHG